MKSISITCVLIIFCGLGFPGPAPASGQRRSTTKPKLSQLAAVESKCFKGVVNSVALKLYPISYPRKARERRLGGKVTVKVFVNEKGLVYSASVVDGPPILHKVTLQAARRAEFAPFTQNDQPVKCAGLLVYTFNAPPPP